METILVYKFDQLSRKELAAMFGLSELKRTRVYQEAREEGVQVGRHEGMQIGRQEGVRLGEAKLLLRLLARRFGELSQQQRAQIAALSLEELERLGEALLDFQSAEEWQEWLRKL